MRPDDFAHFHWPESTGDAPTVGEVLLPLLSANGWRGAEEWAKKANDIAPTIVGGSKKHGGADLGPTRAKRAWAELGVDALGVADAAPGPEDVFAVGPKLTCEMVARIQGWDGEEFKWTFTGKKTSNYRQIGNAFPHRLLRPWDFPSLLHSTVRRSAVSSILSSNTIRSTELFVRTGAS